MAGSVVCLMEGENAFSAQTSPLNVPRIGRVTMAENHVSTRPPITSRCDEALVVRFLCHANSTHVLQSLWRGLSPNALFPLVRGAWNKNSANFAFWAFSEVRYPQATPK